jgi:hypothetical protein
VTARLGLSLHEQIWPVKYLSMTGLSLLRSWNCLFCVADIQAAYLMMQLGGCGRSPT